MIRRLTIHSKRRKSSATNSVLSLFFWDLLRPKLILFIFFFSLPYQSLFGGAGSFTRKHFELINGFSNEFWGWGGEDDDLYQRYNQRILINKPVRSLAVLHMRGWSKASLALHRRNSKTTFSLRKRIKCFRLHYTEEIHLHKIATVINII